MNTNPASSADTSLAYYEKNANAYIDQTLGIDMAETRRRFTTMLSLGARILDLGCGAGRDLAAFADEGFAPIGLEPVRQLADHARAHSGCDVIHTRLEMADFDNEFEGIWACASLLHVLRADLPATLKKLSTWVKDHGILFASFKCGTDERVEDGRYFNDMTPELVKELVVPAIGWKIESVWTGADATRANLQWTNLLARKRSNGA